MSRLLLAMLVLMPAAAAPEDCPVPNPAHRRTEAPIPSLYASEYATRLAAATFVRLELRDGSCLAGPGVSVSRTSLRLRGHAAAIPLSEVKAMQTRPDGQVIRSASVGLGVLAGAFGGVLLASRTARVAPLPLTPAAGAAAGWWISRRHEPRWTDWVLRR